MNTNEYAIELTDLPFDFFPRHLVVSADVRTIVEHMIPVICGRSASFMADFLTIYLRDVKKVRAATYRVEIRCHEHKVIAFHFNISEAVRFSLAWRGGRQRLSVISDRDVSIVFDTLGVKYVRLRS